MYKKIITKLLFILFSILIFIVALREPVFRRLINYKSIGKRNIHLATNKELVSFINNHSRKIIEPDIKQIIKLALEITSERLSFTKKKSNINPNKLFSSKNANCVGYASFFASTCNYLLKKYNFENLWQAKPQIGQLYLHRINIHTYFDSPFFKDHDFVIIENKETNELIGVDPTINDYLKIDYISIAK